MKPRIREWREKGVAFIELSKQLGFQYVCENQNVTGVK